MKDPGYAFERTVERFGIAKIAGGVFEWEVGNGAVLALRSEKDADRFATRDELARDVAAEEAGGACDQRGHQACAPSSRSRSFPVA